MLAGVRDGERLGAFLPHHQTEVSKPHFCSWKGKAPACERSRFGGWYAQGGYFDRDLSLRWTSSPCLLLRLRNFQNFLHRYGSFHCRSLRGLIPAQSAKNNFPVYHDRHSVESRSPSNCHSGPFPCYWGRLPPRRTRRISGRAHMHKNGGERRWCVRRGALGLYTSKILYRYDFSVLQCFVFIESVL